MNWLKQNWVTMALVGVAAVSALDVGAGLRAGRALNNVQVIPSLLAGSGTALTLLFRWINSRTVLTRTVPNGLDADTTRRLEAIYEVAGADDITPDHVTQLSDMAAAMVVGHANRVKAARLAKSVQVIEKKDAIDVGDLRKALGIETVAGPAQ